MGSMIDDHMDMDDLVVLFFSSSPLKSAIYRRAIKRNEEISNSTEFLAALTPTLPTPPKPRIEASYTRPRELCDLV